VDPTEPTGYAAEERTPEEASADLLSLWSRNLHSLGDGGPAKLEGFYRTAPAGPGRAVLLLARVGGVATPVGCQGVGFRRVAFGERVLRAALLADLVVDPGHRTLFPVLTLVRRAREIAAADADFQYGFPNSRALPVLQRAGYRVLGRMARHAAVLRAGPYLERRVGVRALARAGGAVVDVAGALARRAGRRRAAVALRIELVPAPDDRVDAVYRDARGRYPLLPERSAAFLRWRFLAPGRPVEMAIATRIADGAPRAYAVIARDGYVAHLRDFLGATGSDLEALLLLLLPLLRSLGLTSASASFLGVSRVNGILASCGFRPRDAERAVILDASGCPEPLARVLLDAGNHYLTDADEDA
jgi:hypothetical protein